MKSNYTTPQDRIATEYRKSQKLILTIRRDLEQLEKEQYEQQQQALLMGNSNTGASSSASSSSSSSQIDDAIESGLYHRSNVHHRVGGGGGGAGVSSTTTDDPSSSSSPASSSAMLSNLEIEQRRKRLNERVTSNITALSRCEQSLRSMLQQLSAANGKDIWQQQVNHLSNELSFLRTSTNKMMRRISESEHARRLLLGSDENGDYLKSGGGGGRGGATMMSDEERMRHLHAQSSSFQRSVALVEQMKTAGSSVLEMLSTQRETLQGARRRVLDIGLMLGVSQSTIRMIERRNIIDRVIVYGGMMLISCILLYFFWTRVLFK